MGLLQRWWDRSYARPKAARGRLVASGDLAASDLARILAFRSKAGLLDEPAPRFWAGVAHALGHTIGLPDDVRTDANLLIP